MNDDGQLGRMRQRHLIAEDLSLRVARRMIVEIVEPDFAPRDHFGMLRQRCELIEMLLGNFLRLVRMNANTGVNPVVLLSVRNGSVQLFRAGPCANRQQRANASRPRALQHNFAVLRKLRKINMRMRIDQVH